MKKLYRIVATEDAKHFRPQAWNLRKGWYNISDYSKETKEAAADWIEQYSARRFKRTAWIGLK